TISRSVRRRSNWAVGWRPRPYLRVGKIAFHAVAHSDATVHAILPTLRPRSDAAGLQRVLVVDRRDRAAPGPVKFLQQLLGRGAAALDELVERREMARLVVPGGVEAAAAREARMREGKALPGDIEETAPVDGRTKPEPRHGVAQHLPFRGSPVLDDVPGGI